MRQRIVILARIMYALTTFTAAAQSAGPKPNILLILADDLGYHDVGFQGSEHIKTPHLDRMAAEGVRFTDGHVSASVCSPSRAGMITGRYQQRFGHEGNCPKPPNGMDPQERTLGQAMKALGYRTALFGKWHLGDEDFQYPTARGFDEFWGLREGSRPYWWNAKKDKPGNPHAIEHNGQLVKFEGHLTDRLGDQAVQFIETNKDRPFFAFLSFTAPHSPLESKPEDMEALGTDDNYAGLVYGMDRNIGKVLEALERHDLMDNTMIWFLSDNGGITKAASNKPLGGKKGYKFEGGHRVPFVLYWKDHVPAGAIYEKMVSSLDIYPTSVLAAGGTLEQPRPVDGVDLLPYLTGKNAGAPHQRLYWRKLDCAALRDGLWKLIRVDNYGFALYNLENDLAETNDLAAKMPEKVDQMRTLLEAWESDKMDPLWQEGDVWKYVRYRYHTERIKTGINPNIEKEAMAEFQQRLKKTP